MNFHPSRSCVRELTPALSSSRDTSNTVAPPPVLAAAPAKRGPMLARRPAATPQVVAKDQASVSAVHPRPTPSNYATSRVYKPATLYRGAPQRIFTANATPRAPNASFAPGSSIFTLKDMGMAQAQRSDRVVAERKEAGWERARHPEVQRRADHPTAATTSAPSPLSAIHSTAPALHIPSPLVAASSLAITNDAEDMDWDSRPLQPEPEHAQMEDVTMDDDFSSPSGEPMDHTPSLIPSLSSPVFPAMDFFNIIITRAQEDSAHIIRALRACSLSDAECAPSALPSMDAEFPALDEVAAALSACSLAERLDQTGMDANGDVAMADDDDDGMLGCSPLGMACPAPTLSLMDVDIAEDMDVGCDDFPALKTALSSLLGSGRQDTTTDKTPAGAAFLS
ncbi:hypothetical protein BOTBODRAFT_43636 [Botryobasidium botryosum FD-172 SS1]|uniref:Uncharacterized protein n=1 Tax=Botryobasidium botryosum (strain FD-172 SS1) TaxID=930990 RepID=A0A067MWT5_BOTB1|nr:hypothetical protein BOTBODRAFT_43636 [Botryobasidium botryosum FD-172 SS1]